MKPHFSVLLSLASWALIAPGTHATAGAESAAGQILDCRELDTPPKVLRNVRPLYPADLKKAAVAGEAVIGFVVDTQGAVREVEIVRCSQQAFGESARAAVQQWQFSPGLKDGSAVATRLQVPIVFQLDAGSAKSDKS